MFTVRPGATVEDLRIATDLVSRAWVAGSPTVAATVGSIEWWDASSHPDPLADHLRIWSDDGGRPVGWAWDEDGEIEWHAWTGEPARDVGVFAAILEGALADHPSATVASWTAEDDIGATAVLERLGFVPAGLRLSQFQWRPTATPPPTRTSIADGYRIRSLRGPEDIDARVRVHRAAFPSSRLTTDRYERLSHQPHYRFEDDLVVERTDGGFAAFAMAWWDPIGRVGEFEPVGTAAQDQRRGLARALLGYGLRRYADLGATVVQVYTEATNVAAQNLYEGLGFQRRAYHQRYERPAIQSAP